MVKKNKKKQDKKTKNEVVEKVQKGTNFIDNSFAECIHSVTGIPTKIFGDIHANIDRVGVNAWYKPYIEVLKNHGYDMIFFEYNPPEVIGGEKTLNNIAFNNLPTGKCLMLGKDSQSNFKCVTSLINDVHRSKILYDPTPDASFVELSHVGFFIKTFIEIETFVDFIEPMELKRGDSESS